MELLAALAPFAPLGQTLIWALLIVGLIAFFNQPIRKLLEAVQHRVEAGNAVKAGWFELSELKPLSPKQQRDKTKEEVDISTPTTDGQPPPGPTRSAVVATYLQSEDLAIRAIQTEFDVPVMRQIQGASGAELDAVFVKYGRLHVVEVKTFSRNLYFELLRSSVARLAQATKVMGGQRARLILAIVYTGSEPASDIKAKIRESIVGITPEVDLRVYTLSYLKEQFAADDA